MNCTKRISFLNLTRGQLTFLVVLLVILLDQLLKIWVKTDFYLGEDRPVTSWFSLVFVENNGMAFGWEFGSKLFLTLFRIVFVGFLIYFIFKIRKSEVIKTGYVICLGLILAGALGNIIDCMFYGLIFDNPFPPETASLFPPDGGYGSLFHGRVVDMLSFHLFSFDWPQWIPLIGGDHFVFFQPIFNLADTAISVGIIVVIFFYHKQINRSFSELTRLRHEDRRTSE